MCSWIKKQADESVILKVYIQPGASKSEFAGIYGDPPRLKLRIKSAPIEGRANDELIKFLAKFLKIRKSQIRFIRGEQSRQKDLEVDRPYAEVLSKINQQN